MKTELSAAMAAALDAMWQVQNETGVRRSFTAREAGVTRCTMVALERRLLVDEVSNMGRYHGAYRITDKGVNWGAES